MFVNSTDGGVASYFLTFRERLAPIASLSDSILLVPVSSDGKLIERPTGEAISVLYDGNIRC